MGRIIYMSLSAENTPRKSDRQTVFKGKSAHKSTFSITSHSTSATSAFDKYASPSVALDFNVPMLGPAHVSEILKCNGFESGEAKCHYDHIAVNYEAIYLRLGYPDPMKVAEQVEKYAKLRGLRKDKCRILDVACGSGLIGQYLAERGFKHITGCDISPNMLAEAEQKQVYEELLEHDIDELGEFPPHLNNKFDFVVAAGIVNGNHMDSRLFETFMRAAKKEGLIVFASRFSYIGDYWYNEALKKLNQEFRLKLLETDDFFKYDRVPASIGRFSRTPARVFVYENLMDVQATGIRRQILKNM